MKREKGLTAAYEKKKIREGFSFVIGCDEVGRGCLAGPVVAGAVILDYGPASPAGRLRIKDLKNIQDSKLLNPSQRESLNLLIKKHATAWGIGVVSEKLIDKINIHNASLLAMKKAVENLLCHPDRPNASEGVEGSLHSGALRRDDILLALDGKFTIPKFDMKQEAVVDGDAKILSVAAASIIAKVYRDKLMVTLHKKYSKYNFQKHKGYATLEHREAIKSFGLLPVHRRSFCKKYT